MAHGPAARTMATLGLVSLSDAEESTSLSPQEHPDESGADVSTSLIMSGTSKYATS